MMSFERKGPQHVKLPSFSELTTNFKHNMRIKGSIDDSNLPHGSYSAPITPNPHLHDTNQHRLQHHHQQQPSRHKQHRQFISHQQPHHTETPQLQQVPPQFHQPHPASAPPGPHPPSSYSHTSHSFTGSTQVQPVLDRRNPPAEVLNFKFPAQDQPPLNIHLQNEPNYIIRSQGSPYEERQSSIQMHPESSHPLEIHPSTNYPKNDSMDSEASLQTLADIASHSPKNRNNIINAFGEMFQSFEVIGQNINDIKLDFMQHLNMGSVSNHNESHLEFPFSPKEFKMEHFQHLIDNIPQMTIEDTIKHSRNITQNLELLLLQKDLSFRSNQQKKDTNDQKHIGQLSKSERKREMDSSPPPTFKHQFFNDASKSSDNQTITNQIPQVIENKRRKPSRNINTIKKPQNVSLVVKPPKPQTQPTKISNATGELQEDLSIKQDKSDIVLHKCHQCGTVDTPEWRRGPYGSRSLCNACGLFYGKLLKKFGTERATKIMKNRRDSGAGEDRRIPMEDDNSDDSINKF